MRRGRRAVTFALAALLSSGVWVPLSRAEIEKELRIESLPAGAEVFLKRGERETPLGKTHLTYKAEFHSEISILRMVFRKRGYKDKVVEVNAKQDKVMANLEPRPIVANPADHKDPALQAMQQRLNPFLAQAMPGLLATEGPFGFDLAGPMRLARMNEKIYLTIPLLLGESRIKAQETGSARQEALLKSVWDQFAGSLVLSLAQKIKDQAGIDGIVLDAAINEQRYLFGIENRVETRVEMECVPGYDYRSEYDAINRRYVTVTVYNPCKNRVPVTKSEVKVDPKTGAARGQAHARYTVPLALVGPGATPEKLYEKIAVLLTDAKGTQIKVRGAPPGVLSAQQPASP